MQRKNKTVGESKVADIVSVKQLLEMQLSIPPYQRPYKWTIRNMGDLVSDISNAIGDAERYHTEFK